MKITFPETFISEITHFKKEEESIQRYSEAFLDDAHIRRELEISLKKINIKSFGKSAEELIDILKKMVLSAFPQNGASAARDVSDDEKFVASIIDPLIIKLSNLELSKERSKVWQDLRRGFTLEGLDTSKFPEDVLDREGTEQVVYDYFVSQGCEAFYKPFLSMGGQTILAPITVFIRSHFVEIVKKQTVYLKRLEDSFDYDLSANFNNVTWVVNWRLADDKSRLVCQYDIPFYQVTDKDRELEPIMKVKGEVYIYAYGGRGFLRFGALNIETTSPKTIRFSKDPIQYVFSNTDDPELCQLLDSLPTLPFVEDSKLANLNPKRSKAFDYLTMFRSKNQDYYQGFATQQKLMMSISDNGSSKEIAKASKIYNDKHLWQRVNEQILFPSPDVMGNLIAELRKKSVYYMHDKVPSSEISFLSYNTTQFGEFEGTNLVWWVAFDKNKDRFLQKFNQFESKQKPGFNQDAVCLGKGTYQGATPMLLCAKNKLEDEVRLFIDKSQANINAHFTDKDSPHYLDNALFFALFNEQWLLADYLLDEGIEVNHLNFKKGGPSELIIVKLMKNQQWGLFGKILDKLTAMGQQIELAEGYVGHPLYFAVLSQRYDIAQKLIEHHKCYGNPTADDFEHPELYQCPEARKGLKSLTLMQLVVHDLEKGNLHLNEGLNLIAKLHALRQQQLIFCKSEMTSLKAEYELAQVNGVDQATLTQLESILRELRITYLCLYQNLHKRYPASHQYHLMSTSMVLASLNDPRFDHNDNQRFNLIAEMYQDYPENNPYFDDLKLSDYLNGVTVKGYNYNLASFAAQCHRFAFLKQLYEQGACADISWFEERSSVYNEPVSKIPHNHHESFKTLLLALDALRDFEGLKALLQFDKATFEALFALPDNRQRLLMVSKISQNQGLEQYYTDCQVYPLPVDYSQTDSVLFLYHNRLMSLAKAAVKPAAGYKFY